MKTLRFTGSGYEYFKIWIVNILLTAITVGIYYPWAKVRNLRYFYGNTYLEDRNFEYHATGEQIFKGYLIAMGLFIGYTIIQQISLAGGIVVLALLLAAIPWVIWRSLMFSLRMTSFSNVRFSFEGSLGQAYINFLLLPLLLFLCIYGIPAALIAIPTYLAYRSYANPEAAFSDPGSYGGVFAVLIVAIIAAILLSIYLFALMKKRNSMYIINGSRYGQGRFSVDLKTMVFIKILLKTIGLAILVFLGFYIIIAIVAALTFGLPELLKLANNMDGSGQLESMNESGVIFIVIVMYLGMFFCGFLINAYAHTRQRNYIVNNTKLDEKIALNSSLKARSFAWITMSNLFIIIFTLGFGLAWAKVRMTRFVLENTHIDTETGFDDYLTQQQKHQSSLGEQIGDAFDVDIGLGI